MDRRSPVALDHQGANAMLAKKRRGGQAGHAASGDQNRSFGIGHQAVLCITI
jgi:hypothetical protein